MISRREVVRYHPPDFLAGQMERDVGDEFIPLIMIRFYTR